MTRLSCLTTTVWLLVVATSMVRSYGLTNDKANTGLPAAELAGLKQVYNTLGGAQWKTKAFWLNESMSACDWFGVTCVTLDTLHITALKLPGNKLKGELGPNLQPFSHLVEVDFSGNALTGPLPSDLGNLVHLSLINLSNNLLSEAIPTTLGSLTHLITLDLSANQLNGVIPSSFSSATTPDLVFISLAYNSLSGDIPYQLGSLQHLTSLDLSHNAIVGNLPSSFDQLAALQILRVQENQLIGPIPEEAFKALPNLNLVNITLNCLPVDPGPSMEWCTTIASRGACISMPQLGLGDCPNPGSPSGGKDFPPWAAAIIALIVISAAVAAVMLFKRREKRLQAEALFDSYAPVSSDYLRTEDDDGF